MASGLQAMGLCYLELNAALGTGLGTDWPVAVDHGSTMETSWVAALEPDLVDVDRLPDDPAATRVGVYGPNPRFTVDAARGAAQIDAAAGLLAERAPPCCGASRSIRSRTCGHSSSATGRNGSLLAGRAGSPGDARSTGGAPAHQPWTRVALPVRPVVADRRRLDPECLDRAGQPDGRGDRRGRARVDLGPERGFYIRRQQTAEVRLPDQVRGRTARGPPRPLAGRRHRDGARRDGRVPVSLVGPRGMVRTVRGPVDPAALGSRPCMSTCGWIRRRCSRSMATRRPPRVRGTPRPQPKRAGTRASTRTTTA